MVYSQTFLVCGTSAQIFFNNTFFNNNLHSKVPHIPFISTVQLCVLNFFVVNLLVKKSVYTHTHLGLCPGLLSPGRMKIGKRVEWGALVLLIDSIYELFAEASLLKQACMA